MEQNSLEKDPKLGEKTAFSDTGSAIFENSQENQDKIGENPNVLNETIQNTPENAENAENSAVSKEKTPNFLDETSKATFSKDFPDVDIEKLCSSQDFQALLAILTKNPTLSEIYAYFNKINESAEEKSAKKLLQALANAKSSVGALSTAQNIDHAYFTKDQVLKMSPEQIKAHYNAIRKSQQRW